MKLAITYKVNGVPFKYETENVHDLFNATAAVIKANKLMYPDQDTILNEYLVICAELKSGKKCSHENHIFKIERVVEQQ